MFFAQPEEDEMLVPHQELVAADAAQPMEGAMLIALYGGFTVLLSFASV